MKRYRAVLFDLFGTIALIGRDKLPLFEWNGIATRSTTGALRELYEAEVRDVSFARFVTALGDVLREQQEARPRDLREVSSVLRFTRTLLRAGLSDSPSTQRLAGTLAAAHSAQLADATEIPPEHVSFLGRVRARYPLALVSNFDDGAVARAVLQKGGVLEHFLHVVISVEHGWRKPRPEIFADALAALGVEPHEALFIGDSPEEDVGGAKRLGMDVAWVNREGNPLPPGIATPEYTIRSIPAIEDRL